MDSPLTLLRKILIHEMGLSNEQILVYNQKWDIPKNFDIFISLSFISSKPFGNSISYEQKTNENNEVGLYEILSINKIDTIGIDILSRGEQALLRKDEIILAFRSTYSEQMQELNACKIGRLPISFLDLSYLEESARLFRFRINVNITSFTKKEQQIEYFDTFDYILTTNK